MKVKAYRDAVHELAKPRKPETKSGTKRGNTPRK
jgi:hypothetical protein